MRLQSTIKVALLIVTITSILYFPVFRGKTPIAGNLLVSFYNPWAQETIPNWEQGIPKKPTGIDDIRIFYPQRIITNKIIKSLQIPAWDPYSYAGTFHLARSETAVFYPLNFLFLMLPQNISWIILVFIQPIIASLGMYLYLVSIVKDQKASILGGLTFGFSSLVIVRSIEGLSVGHSLIWLPYVLWGTELYFQSLKIKYLTLQTSALVLSLLAGWFQYTFYIFALGSVYSLYKITSLHKFKNKETYLSMLPFLLAPLLSLFHLIPSIEAYFISPRGAQALSTAASHLMPLSHLFTLLTPDLFGNPGTYNYFGKSEYKEAVMYTGVIPLILGLYSFSALKKHSLVVFFLFLTALSLLIGIDNPISRFVLSLPIPILSSFLPNRIFLITTFGMSVLTAFGTREFLKNRWEKSTINVIMPILCILSALVILDIYLLLQISEVKYLPIDTIATYIPRVGISLRTIIYSLGDTPLNSTYMTQMRNGVLPHVLVLFFMLLVLLRKKTGKMVFIICCLAIIAFGQFYFARKYIYFSENEFIFPSHPVFTYLEDNAGINRFVSLGDGHIKPNFQATYSLYSPDGVGSMYIQRYGELVNYAQSTSHSISPIPRIEISIAPHPRVIFDEKDPYYDRLFQILGIKYIIKLNEESITYNSAQSDRLDEYTKVFDQGKWNIYEYKDAYPRYFLESEYKVVNDNNNLLAKIFSNENNIRKVYLEEKPKLKLDNDQTATVELLSYTPNKVVFTTNSKTPQLLYLSDAYHPKFKAKIDETSTDILRANYAFRAVLVPSGKHTVTMYYDTSSIWKLIALSGSILGASAIVIFFSIKTKRLKW